MNNSLQIEYLPIDSLKPYANNSRTHSPEQIEEIANSITLYGMNTPISLNSEGIVIAGHGRLEALKKLGAQKVPCVRLSHLDEESLRKGYTIADNKIALKSDWDLSKLADEFKALEDAGFSALNTFFSQDEIDAILNPEPEFDSSEGEGEAADEEAEPITKLGDIWILGHHRLMCGDSTSIDAVEQLFDYAKPCLMVTDPPYGVKYDPSWREGADLGVGQRSTGLVLNDDRVDWTDAYSLFTGAVAYVWHAGKYTHTVASNLEDCGFDLISQIIWAKQHFALSRGDYHWQHEPCWYAVRKGENHQWCGKRDQATLWEIKNNNAFGNANAEETVGHGTQKPLECMSRPIQNNSKPGEHVYDPFLGSGTTLIACEKLGRMCLGMELSPKYVDIIVRRWQKETNQLAKLQSSGELFNSLAQV